MDENLAFQPRLTRSGETVPVFEAETTMRVVRSEDYVGSRLIIFSHPAELSPANITEAPGLWDPPWITFSPPKRATRPWKDQ